MTGELASLARAVASDVGRSHAENALAEHFLPIVRLYGRRHLRTDAAAEDLAQDTLGAVLVALRAGMVTNLDDVGGFVHGVARNKVREARRVKEVTRRVDVDPPEGSVTHEPVLVGLRMHLFFCLAQLTESARQVLMRTYFYDEDSNEVGAALSLAAGNVRVIRHRALEALRRCLEPGDER